MATVRSTLRHSASAQFDHAVLAEVISRRWTDDCPYFRVTRKKARGSRPEASWWRQPADGALELHCSRGSCPGLPLPSQAKVLEGAV